MAYNPAGILSTTTAQAHLNLVHYTNKALDQLRTKFVYRDVFDEFTLPRNSGLSIQMHRYDNLSPNLTPAVEGDVPTSLTLSSKAVRCSVSLFSSFIAVSDLQEATAPDNQLVVASENLGYRAGYSVDNLHRGIIDDQAPHATLALAGSNFTVADARNGRHQLQALNILPFKDGLFKILVHPYVSYDLVNDPNVNGLADITKYTARGNGNPLFSYEDRGLVTEVAGCRIEETTSVFSETISTVNYYRTYIFGKGGLGSVSLEGFSPSKVRDPQNQNFKIMVNRFTGGSVADPTNAIAGSVAYKFACGGTHLSGPEGIGGPFRFRVWACPSTIA